MNPNTIAPGVTLPGAQNPHPDAHPALDAAPGTTKPKKLKYVMLREEFVALTGDTTQAILLARLESLTQQKHDLDAYIDEERARALKAGAAEPALEKSHAWIWKKAEELAEEALLVSSGRPVSAQTIRRHLNAMVEHGWLEVRRNPQHAWDRTLQYRVDLVALQRDLKALGYTLSGWNLSNDEETPENTKVLQNSKLQNGGSKLQNGGSELQNGGAIPYSDIHTPTTPPTAVEEALVLEDAPRRTRSSSSDARTHTGNSEEREQRSTRTSTPSPEKKRRRRKVNEKVKNPEPPAPADACKGLRPELVTAFGLLARREDVVDGEGLGRPRTPEDVALRMRYLLSEPGVRRQRVLRSIKKVLGMQGITRSAIGLAIKDATRGLEEGEREEAANAERQRTARGGSYARRGRFVESGTSRPPESKEDSAARRREGYEWLFGDDDDDGEGREGELLPPTYRGGSYRRRGTFKAD